MEEHLLVGNNYKEYYEKKFELLGDKKMISFNVMAFIFSTPWLLYRKQNVFAISMFFITFFFGFFGTIASVVSSVGVCFITGFFGNYFYRKQVKSYADKSKNMHPDDKIRYLTAKGGTSIFSIVIGYLAYIAVMSIMNNMMINAFSQ